EFQLPDLVAAQADTCQIIPLEEDAGTQSRAQAGRFIERGGQLREIQARHIRDASGQALRIRDAGTLGACVARRRGLHVLYFSPLPQWFGAACNSPGPRARSRSPAPIV